MPEFMIGTANNIYDFLPLSDYFSPVGSAYDPDWSFQPYATSIRLANGVLKGQGFPIAIWRFNHLSNENRDALKALVTGLSGPIFIYTPTNESDAYGDPIWKTFSGVMSWTPEDEDKAARETLGLVLTFTHLVEEA